MKTYVINHIFANERLSQEDKNFLNYLFKNEKREFKWWCMFMDNAFLDDMLLYVQPSKWKYFAKDESYDIYILSEHLTPIYSPLDFKRDIMDQNIHSSKLHKMRNGDLWKWFDF